MDTEQSEKEEGFISDGSIEGEGDEEHDFMEETNVEKFVYERHIPTLEENLATNVETVMISIQGVARQLSIAQEEYEKVSKELQVLKTQYDYDRNHMVTETKRTRAKCHNVHRDINRLKEDASVITNNLMKQVNHIDDVRRLNQVFLRQMVISRDLNYGQQKVNRAVENSVKRSRSMVTDMMGAYKQGVTKSVNLRRNIISEIVTRPKSICRGKEEKFDPTANMPKIQPWELRARDLVKHRIKISIIKNRERSFTVSNYQERMESFDFAMSYIKDKESVPDLNEIITTLARFQGMQDDIATKNYIGAVETDRILSKNNKLIRESEQMAKLLKERSDFNKINMSKAGEKDKFIAKKLKSCKREVIQLSEDFLEFKEIAYQGYMFFEPSILTKHVPISRDMMQQEFIAIGSFNPMKLMGWFTQLITKMASLDVRPKMLETVDPNDPTTALDQGTYKKGIHTDHDNSTTVGNSRGALNSHMSDSDILRGTVDDEIEGN